MNIIPMYYFGKEAIMPSSRRSRSLAAKKGWATRRKKAKSPKTAKPKASSPTAAITAFEKGNNAGLVRGYKLCEAGYPRSAVGLRNRR